MLRLVTKLAAYFSVVAAVMAYAGWGWGEQGAASQESSFAKPGAPDWDAEQSPQALFQSLPRFGERVFALPAAAEVESKLATAKTPQSVVQSSAGSPLANQPVPPTYIIGPGDRLSLCVWSQSWEQVRETVTVSPEGIIVLPESGQMTAAGQTLEQLREALREGYSRS